MTTKKKSLLDELLFFNTEVNIRRVIRIFYYLSVDSSLLIDF